VSKIEDAYERLLIRLAETLSERQMVAVAVFMYGGIGLLLPLAARWSVLWLVLANITGTMLAGTLLLMWIALRVQAGRRRNLLEWTTDLRRLDAAEFEWLVGEIYRRDGWVVAETGRQDAPDGGIDLFLQRGRDRAVIQCKRWSTRQVGVEQVRAFAGAVSREGLPLRSSIFVTLSSFTGQAVAEGQKLGMTLVDNTDLHAMAERVRRPQACPKCSSPMLLDRSPRGWWFRCIASGCDGKHDLGRDPAQAIELLTAPPE
jgi:hypothetical protein